jgi:hypothetical protein
VGEFVFKHKRDAYSHLSASFPIVQMQKDRQVAKKIGLNLGGLAFLAVEKIKMYGRESESISVDLHPNY